MLPRLATPGAPPFLRGFFASPKSAGVYGPGGFAWANQVSEFGDGGHETTSLNQVQGQVRGAARQGAARPIGGLAAALGDPRWASSWGHAPAACRAASTSSL
jgi:hypothetical protein